MATLLDLDQVMITKPNVQYAEEEHAQELDAFTVNSAVTILIVYMFTTTHN